MTSLFCAFCVLVSAVPLEATSPPEGLQAIVSEGKVLGASWSMGRWRKRGGSLKGGKGGDQWLSTSLAGTLKDGEVVARLTMKGKPKVALMFRATRDKKGLWSGYEVEISRGRVSLIRLDRGRRVVLSERYRVRHMSRVKLLEVRVLMFGGDLAVELRDHGRGKDLTSLSARDGTYRAGNLGLSIRRNPEGVGLEWLGSRRLCRHQKTAGDSLKMAHYATISDEALQSLPPDVLAHLEPMERHSAEGEMTLRADRFGLEAMWCAGVESSRISSSFPWKYLDPAYLAYRDDPEALAPSSEEKIDPLLTYSNPEMMESLLRAYHVRHPGITKLVQFGESAGGRPLWALAIGRQVHWPKSQAPTVLLNGAHHGDELLSTFFVLDAIDRLLEEQKDPEVARWLDELVVWCVPMVNPDGVVFTLEQDFRNGRKNGRKAHKDGIKGSRQGPREGVDLNRNYPFKWGALGEKGSKSSKTSGRYRGPEEASEPETQAMIRLAESEGFVASMSYHTGTVALLVPYTIDGLRNPDPNEAMVVAKEVAAKLEPIESGRRFEIKRKLYSVDGTDQDWHRFTHGTLALLLEGYSYSPAIPKVRRAAVARVRPAWSHLMTRFLEGPSVDGHVVDHLGRPVRAEVRIGRAKARNGERWMTRCRDGHFARYLPKPGTYLVRAFIEGKEVARQEVEVEEGIREVILVVDQVVEPVAVCIDASGMSHPPHASLAEPPSFDPVALRRVLLPGVVASAKVGGVVFAASRLLPVTPKILIDKATQERALDATPANTETPASPRREETRKSCSCVTWRRGGAVNLLDWRVLLLLFVGLLWMRRELPSALK